MPSVRQAGDDHQLPHGRLSVGRRSMTARAFTNPNVGKEVRIEQYGREVHLIFKASTEDKADALVENLLAQLKNGAVDLTVRLRRRNSP